MGKGGHALAKRETSSEDGDGLKLRPEEELKADDSLANPPEITERKMIEEVMRFLLECGSKGDDFFASLAQYLARGLGMDFISIDKLEDDCLTASTLAVYFDGKFEDNVSYTLHDTLRGDVVGKDVCFFPSGVRHRFADDEVLKAMMAESYIGVTLWSHTHKPIGLISAIGRQPLASTQLSESIMELVAIRAAAELERRKAEEEMQEAHEQNQVLLDSISDAFFAIDEQMIVTYYNHAAERLLGRAARDVVGRELFDAFPEARGSVFEINYRRALATKQSMSFEVNFEVPPFLNWYDVRVYPTRRGISVFFQVTTEHKQLEKALLESKEIAETLIETVPT